MQSTLRYNSTFNNMALSEDFKPATILKELETSYYEDPERFIPVTLKDIKTGPFAGIDLYVKTSVGNKTKYVLYYKGNNIFGDEKKEDLIRRNIHKLFIPKNGKARYMQYIEANLKDIISDEMEEKEVKVKVAYEVGINMVKDIFANETIESKLIDRTKDWIFTMIDFILENDRVYSNIARIMQYDESVPVHCVNTTVIGLLFARYTGLDIKSINALGMGLLLHDIGLIKLKKNNISDEHIKTEDNKESDVWQHPLLGAAILDKTRRFAPETLELIRQHHEYVDGTGYPYNLKGREINQLAKYTKIIDEYDLLMTVEKVKNAENPHYVVLNKMVNHLKNKLDINLLTNFVKFSGTSYRKSSKLFDSSDVEHKDNRVPIFFK